MKRRSYVIILVRFLLLAIIFLLDSCQNRSNSKNNSNAQTISILPQIDGFYVFKRNMSFLEVSKLLKERKINFKKINLDEQNKIYCPLSLNLIRTKSLKDFKNIKIIEGFNLYILNKNLNKFQIGFFNDTIFFFIYQQHFDEEYFANSRHKENIIFTNQVFDNIELLKTLSEGLNYKYGEPIMFEGDLYAYCPSTSPSQLNDNTHKRKDYFARQFWLSKDSIIQIRLQHEYFIDSSKLQPYKIKTERIILIEVLFNTKYASEIRKFDSEKYYLEVRTDKKRMDSLLIQKNKQFNGL